MTKTDIKKFLTNCAFDPNKGIHKMLRNISSINYYHTRAIETILNLDSNHPDEYRTQIQSVIVLLTIAYFKTLEEK